MNSTLGVLAEFSGPGALLQAAERVRDAGYRCFDCHSPFPIHGMDQAMGMKRSRLGFIIAVFGLMGAGIGMGLQYWVHSVTYPHVLSGKPYFAWQAYIIVTFALFVLLGAISAVLGMLHLNRLPRYHHPVFYSERFRKVSDDGFFLSIEARDPRFDPEATPKFLEEIGSTAVELLEKK
jgi:hypothetical protein